MLHLFLARLNVLFQLRLVRALVTIRRLRIFSQKRSLVRFGDRDAKLGVHRLVLFVRLVVFLFFGVLSTLKCK